MLKKSVVCVESEFIIPDIVRVSFYPLCREFKLIDINVIARFAVVLQPKDEFILEGLFTAERVALHIPLTIDSWFGRVIMILLFAPKRFERLIEKE